MSQLKAWLRLFSIFLHCVALLYLVKNLKIPFTLILQIIKLIRKMKDKRGVNRGPCSCGCVEYEVCRINHILCDYCGHPPMQHQAIPSADSPLPSCSPGTTQQSESPVDHCSLPCVQPSPSPGESNSQPPCPAPCLSSDPSPDLSPCYLSPELSQCNTVKPSPDINSLPEASCEGLASHDSNPSSPTEDLSAMDQDPLDDVPGRLQAELAAFTKDATLKKDGKDMYVWCHPLQLVLATGGVL